MMFRLIRNLKPNDCVVYNGIDATVWEIDLEKNSIGLKFTTKNADIKNVVHSEFFTRFIFFDTDYIQYKNRQ